MRQLIPQDLFNAYVINNKLEFVCDRRNMLCLILK